MRLFGLTIEWRSKEKALTPVPQRSLWRIVTEPFTGAWQRNITETVPDLLAYPTLYACISRIARDIGKLPFVLKERTASGVWIEVRNNPAYSPVLRKPNHYQTAQQFRELWQLSKLIQGNTYVLKQRDERGVVNKLYVLDPARVKPLVSDSGDVFYELMTDNLNLLPELNGKNPIVPAREIIHDRELTVHHPLIGVPPLCAAYWPAAKNLKILRGEAEFFANGAAPGGILEVPGAVDDEVIRGLAQRWQENFSGSNAGKVAVISDGMKYNQLKASSADSQLVEQMKYSDEQICFAFGVPPYKIGLGSIPPGWKSDDVNIQYHSDALSDRIEHMENLMDEGLSVSLPLGIELNTDPLWRMDEGKMAEVQTKLVGGKIKLPDEARAKFDLLPTAGGDTLWGQHQDYPLGVLAQRNDLAAIQETPEPDPEPENEDETRALVAELFSLKAMTAAREEALR